jgi:hypothetical protein
MPADLAGNQPLYLDLRRGPGGASPCGHPRTSSPPSATSIPDRDLEVDVGVDNLPVALRLQVAGTSDPSTSRCSSAVCDTPVNIDILDA